MERVNEDSPKEFESSGNNVDDTIGSGNNVDDSIGSGNNVDDYGQNKNKNNTLINKLVGFFKPENNDKTFNSDLHKDDNLNENWENRNVDYEDQQVTPRNTGNFITRKAEETGNFLKKEAEKVANVVRKKLDIEDKPPSYINENNNEKEDLTKKWSSDDKDVTTKPENWISSDKKFEKNNNENWTQRYVDYDKQDVTPRDISNDYIKDEMVGNVRGVYLKTRTLENSDLNDNSTNTWDKDNLTDNLDQNKDNSTTTWDKTKDNLTNAWDKTKDNLTNAGDKTKENLTYAWDKTKDNLTNAWDKTKENLTNTSDKDKDNLPNTWDQNKDNLSNTRELNKDNMTNSRSEDNNVAGFVDPNKNEMEPRNNINV